MKIGFFGNTNNYPLMLAQAMRRLGHEVILVLNRNELLNRPENRDPALSVGYPDWIMDASHFSEWDYISLCPRIAPVLDVLSSCDALILNDLGPSLFPLVNRPAIALLTGSDLTHYADNDLCKIRADTRDEEYNNSAEGQMTLNLLQDFIKRQRQGIRESFAVSAFPRGVIPLFDIILNDIDVPDNRRFFVYMSGIDQIKFSPLPDNETVRIFCATRLTWKLPMEPERSPEDYKGSDVMVRGLGLFYRQTGTRLDIRLVKKGLHVAELEDLIAKEGLTDQVTWSEEMPLHEVWAEFARCDIVFEQLGTSIIGMSGLDAMAAGRPVIGNGVFEQTMPVCQAKTPEEVCEQLKRLVFDPGERQKIGAAGRQYVEKNCSPDYFASICLERYQSACLSPGAIRQRGDAGHAFYLQRKVDNQQRFLECRSKLAVCEAECQSKLVTSENLLKAYLRSGVRGLKRHELRPPFTREGGHCWKITLSDFSQSADDLHNPTRSILLVFEDEEPLGPAHAVHEDIRNLGKGCFSHWAENLYFSTSDNSDPNTNRRKYKVLCG